MQFAGLVSDDEQSDLLLKSTRFPAKGRDALDALTERWKTACSSTWVMRLFSIIIDVFAGREKVLNESATICFSRMAAL